MTGNPFDQFDEAKTSTPQEFAKAYGPAAQRAADKLGVDPSVVLGQWGLETGWGKSIIPGTHNLGNIKDFSGGGTAATDNMTGSRDKYRAYASPETFADDYSDLISRKYKGAVGAKTPEAFAQALKAGGYAEDPQYVGKVTQAARMAGTKANPLMEAAGRAVGAIIPSAEAAQPNPFDQFDAPATPRIEVRGTSADAPQGAAGEGRTVSPITSRERIAQGLVDPINGGAQLLTNMLPNGLVQAGNRLNNMIADKTGLVARLPEGGVDQQVRDQEAEYQARRQVTAGDQKPGFDAMRLVGNVMSPANIALAGAGPAGPAMSMGARVGSGAAVAGASGAMAPVTEGSQDDYAKQKAIQIALSAGMGAAVPAVTAGVGRLISPNASTNANNLLLQNEGVKPTIGQTLGGMANNIEQRLTSIPVLGDMISSARRGAQDDLRRAAQNRVTDPLRGVPGTTPSTSTAVGPVTAGAAVPLAGTARVAPAARVAETGFDGVQQVTRAVDDAYAAARNAMGPFRLDQQANQEINQIRQMVGALDPKEQRAFQQAWNEIAQDISPNGTIPAELFKRVDSKLGQDAARFSKSQDPYQQQLGDALTALKQTIQNSGRRQNPQAGQLFDQADEAFANLVRVQQASKAAVNQEGRFTPGQLNQAVRAGDGSVRGNQAAQGNALMQDLSNAGQQVLGNTIPDSGTAGRAMWGGGALASGLVNPLIPAGIGASSLLYTQPAQNLMRSAVMARPQGAQAVRNSLQRISPALGPAAGQLAIEARK